MRQFVPRRNGMAETNEAPELLTPSEVAALFRVNPKTVTRWARAGRISYIKTLGGHRRFRADEIRKLVSEGESSSSR
jgi:excisionase family DNA binding protein